MCTQKPKLMPKNERDKFISWFNKNDYSFLNSITIGGYLDELEERLELYHFAKLCNGNCRTDSRWMKLTASYLKETLSHNITQLKVNHGLTASGVETEGVIPLKGNDLHLLLQIKKSINDPAEDVLPESVSDIPEYTRKSLIRGNQNEYFFPLQANKKQVAFLVDFERSNEELIKQFSALLPQIREKVDISEPVKEEGYSRQLQSLRTFTGNKAIQYLDVLLYCFIVLLNCITF